MIRPPMFDLTFRPLISVIRVTPDRQSVEVNLDLDGREANGFGEVVGGDTVTAACEAACAAVRRLLPEQVEVRLRWAERFDRRDEDMAVITSAVEFTTPDARRPQVLLGAAVVHGDEEVAAVRATLDGLTRRLAPAMFG